MIFKKFFSYFLISLILISSILPYSIDMVNAQAPPPQSGQTSIVGSNINMCSSGSPTCNIITSGGGNEYLYAGASGCGVGVSAADFVQDLQATSSGTPCIAIGHSSSNMGTINSGRAINQGIGGIGVVGILSETLKFENNESNTISGNFNLPQDSLVVLVSSSSGRVLSPISVSPQFAIDQQTTQGSSLGIILAHATLSAGSQQFTLTYSTNISSMPDNVIGVVLYVFPSSSLTNNTPPISNSQTQTQSQSPSTSIPVGSNPSGISFAPSNNNVYVANSGSNTVSVISSSTNNVITTLNVGSNPCEVAYDPSNQDVYVTNSGSNNVSVIRTRDNMVIDTIPVGTGPCNLSYDPANQEMYIANSGNSPGPSNTVSVISSTTNTVVDTITVDPNPIRLAFDPSNNDIYVDNYASGEVTVIDGTSNTVIKTISVGANPNTVGYDPANNDMYVTSNNSNNVYVISSATNNLLTTLTVGTNPFGVFYDPANQEIFVSNTVSNTVSTINPTNAVYTINVGIAPYHMTFDPDDNDMYISNTAGISGGASSMSVINSGNTVVTALTVGTNPDYSVFDPSNNEIYVSNTGSGTISVIPSQTTGQSTSQTSPPLNMPSNTSNIQTNCPTTNSPTVDNYNIAGAESLSLNHGSCEYFFVGSTAGGQPMNQITWNQDLGVTAAYSGNLAISIGNQLSNAGSYNSQAGNHGIAGVGVSGFDSYDIFTASTSDSDALSTSFSTDPNDLVLMLVGGEGDGNLTLSGVQAKTLADQTYSEAGSNVIASEAIYESQLPAGTYNINMQSITYPTNSGTSLGIVVYVFHSSGSTSSSSSSQNMQSQKLLPPPVMDQTSPQAGVSTQENPVSCTDQLGITCNFVLDKNGLYDLILTIPPPTGSEYRLLSETEMNSIANSITTDLQSKGFGISISPPSYVASVATQDLVNTKAVELIDALISAPSDLASFITSGNALGIAGYGLSTADILSNKLVTLSPPEIVTYIANNVFSGDEKTNEDSIITFSDSGNFLINVNQESVPYHPTYIIGPKQYIVLTVDELQLPSQENSFALNVPISWVDLPSMVNNISVQPPTSANAPPESSEILALHFNPSTSGIQPSSSSSQNNPSATPSSTTPTATTTTTPPTITLNSPSTSNLTVAINGAASPTSQGATINDFSWQWGDGQTSTGNFPQSHTYFQYGFYTVTVTVTDSNGQSNSATVNVNLASNPLLGFWNWIIHL